MDTIAKWTIIILLVLMIGCANIDTVKTRITIQDDLIVEIDSKHDALVSFKNDNIEGVVDNRGTEGFWKGLLQYMLAKPGINISK